MSLAEKTLNTIKPGCGFGSECQKGADRKFFGDLFSEEWEVLVIKHDQNAGKYNWFTLCCEAADVICNAKTKPVAAACC